MNETTYQRNIQAALKERFGSRLYMFKTHGSGYTKKGNPDLIGCVDGHFIAIETKVGDGEPTKIQDKRLSDIREAGGFAIAVSHPQVTPEMVVYYIEAWLELNRNE